ncbi:MAG TPA: IS3 family transposase [Marinobacter hydrocarbonoclasticus]|uniref:IS3 family transposase n=1 Tax=Marinobacter TaxID=2742 RepID=UPI000C91B8D3|nr:IS3 family transposase [Marinobacter sp.]MAC21127.1 IS3 family transposase [Marinobacter sp.]HAX09523.1 IS3 family transposase [Marinobacter nauticus]HCL37432.1 IS3 family transposase [Marinobacter nauticus]HCR47894.1 IS3 family transposase [Marinobacter nauticus]
MKRSRYTEEQIAFALKQAELGTSVPEVCRKMGVSDATFYNWRKKYGGLGPSELKRLKQLEEENHRLKKLVADLSLDKAMLQDVVGKKALRPPRKRQLVADLQARYGVSERQACAVLQFSRASCRYQSVARDSSALSMRIREITLTRLHYGYRRVHVQLQREGWRDNHKRVYRLYRDQGLSLRLKRPRRNKAAKNRQPLQQANHPNHIWGMDFVSDALFDGRRLRLLTIIDLFTRECLGIVVGQSLKGHDVQEALTAIARFRGNPEVLKTDNGSEFAGKVMDRWAYERNIEIDFSRPGKPTDNATVESFNGRLRQECLNENWFLSLADAREKIEAWRAFYNQVRPHSALEWSTPSDYARKHAVSRRKQKQLEPDFSNSGWT